MRENKVKTFYKVGLFVFLIVIFSGCNKMDLGDKKTGDIEYIIIEESDIPDPLVKYINDKKENPFKLTYANEDDLYIVIGYGKQISSGYSIKVDDLYTSNKNIIVKTSLIGPNEEDINEIVTYPYIVLKMQYIDKEVKFL